MRKIAILGMLLVVILFLSGLSYLVSNLDPFEVFLAVVGIAGIFFTLWSFSKWSASKDK